MHFIVSWDIKAVGDLIKPVEDGLKGRLEGYSWVRPLPNFYVVRVANKAEYDAVLGKLVEFAKEHPKALHFIVSPLMSGGSYNGWLPSDLWPKLREHSE